MNSNINQFNTNLFYETLIQSYVKTPHFVERTWLRDQVEEALVDPGCRFLLLTAEPGAGKTAFSAWLAHQHPNWPRYFIRRDSQTPLSSGDARSCLFTVGHQLAALHPGLFRSEQLEVVVKQRVGELQEGGKAVGIQVEDLKVSPFYQTALKVEQNVQVVAGELAGISIKRAITEQRFFEIDNLQYMALLDPAKALLREDPKARIILLIDALDELRYHPGQDNILKWLASCPELPPNVRIVLTSRPDEMLNRFKFSQKSWLRKATIVPHSEHVQTDLRHYTAGFTTQDAVKNALIEQKVDAGDFTTQSVTKAEGNFQYLTALFQGITQTIELNQQEQLHRLLSDKDIPSGLEDLYAFFLTLIKDSVVDHEIEFENEDSFEVTHLPAWEGLYQPILGVLAVALEPLTVRQIANLGNIRTQNRWLRGALGRLGQFLEQDNGHYRLYHSSFPEFLTSPATKEKHSDYYLNPDEWHRKLITFYQRQGGAWEKINWREVDDYGLIHLSAHLYMLRHTNIGRNTLYQLICKSFMKEKFDRTRSHRAFVIDVELMIEATSIKPYNFAQLVRGCLIQATLGDIATSMPPKILATLAQLGQVDKAQDYAFLIQDPVKQSEAYQLIGDILLKRKTFDEAQETLEQALSISAEIESDNLKRRGVVEKAAEMLIQVVGIDRTVEVAEATGNEYCKDVTVEAIINFLIRERDTERLLQIAETTENNRIRHHALIGMAEVLIWNREFDEAFRMIETFDEEYQTKAFIKIIPILAQMNENKKAQDITQYVLYNSLDAMDLYFNARMLALAGDIEYALEMMEVFEKVYGFEPKDGMLKLLATDLAKIGATEQAIKLCEEVKFFGVIEPQAEIIKALIKSNAIERAVKLAEKIVKKDENFYELLILAEVARALAKSGATEEATVFTRRVLAAMETPTNHSLITAEILVPLIETLARLDRVDQGLKIINRIEDNLTKTEILGELTQILIELGDKIKALEVVDIVFKKVVIVEDEFVKAEAFGGVCKGLLKEGQVVEAIETISSIRNDVWKARVLTKVAESLTGLEANKEKTQIAINYALELVEGLADVRAKAELLAELSQCLVQVGNQKRATVVANQALEEAEAIENNNLNKEVLKGVAETLQKMEKVHESFGRNLDLYTDWYLAKAITWAKDKKQLLRIYDRTISLIDTIDDAATKAIILTHIALFLWGTEDVEKPGNFSGPITKVLRFIEYSKTIQKELKANIIEELAIVLTWVRDKDKAEEAANQAVKVGNRVRRPLEYDDYVALVSNLVRIVDRKEAIKIAYNFLSSVEKLEDESSRERGLSDVVGILALVCEFSQAFKVIKQITSTLLKADGIRELANALIYVDRRDIDITDQTIDCVNMVIEGRWQDYSRSSKDFHLKWIASDFARARDYDLTSRVMELIIGYCQEDNTLENLVWGTDKESGIEIVNRLLDLSFRVEDRGKKVILLVNVANALVRLEDKKRVVEVTKHAMQIAKVIESDRIYFLVAKVLFRVGEFELALKLVDTAKTKYEHEDERLLLENLEVIAEGLIETKDRIASIEIINRILVALEKLEEEDRLWYNDCDFDLGPLSEVSRTLFAIREHDLALKMAQMYGKAGIGDMTNDTIKFLSQSGEYDCALEIVKLLGKKEVICVALGEIAGALVQEKNLEEIVRVLQVLFDNTRSYGRECAFTILKQGAPALAKVDQGNTLLEVYQAVLEVENWW